jgi:hypothetical protein
LKNEEEETSEGLNQIFEIINAKGDTGELKEILDSYDRAKLEDNQKANYKRPRE